MPVDPGNLLMLGKLGNIDVIGAPGCARSPRENGFDWILERLLASYPVTADDIIELGVGGLLMEIVSRPQPRAGKPEAGGPVAAVILAAGRSTRMGERFKLIERIGGQTLVERAVDAAIDAGIDDIVVVTGNRAADIAEALGERKVRYVHNPDYAEGLSTSLKAGIGALDGTCAGALVMLADMPGVDGALVTALREAHGSNPSRIVVPVFGGKRGNPVLWGARYFPALMTLQGDIGARHLISEHADAVVELPATGEAIFDDVDTPEALDAVRARIESGEG